MSRKQRIDSSTAAVRVMASALTELMPPEHCPLPKAAMPFWRSIIHGRTREEWIATPALLVTASGLAWTQWQSVKIRGEIELTTEVDAKAVKRLDDLNRLEMAYLRTLQQHGRGAEGEARDVGKRRSQSTGLLQGARAVDDDDLIARPTAH
jgi:hypothetical protein